MKAKEPTIRVLHIGILAVVGLICLFPFVWMIFSSFKTLAELVRNPPTFFPLEPTFDNFIKVWKEVRFSIFFRNSIYVATVKTLVILYTSALVGYVLSKIPFKGREAVFIFVLATMMVPWPVLILPLYQEMVWIRWIDSYHSLIWTAFFNSFGIFMMRQFISSIPDSLGESARIDGCSELHIFHKIILPLLGPALSALAIFTFLVAWDDFMWPYLMINTEVKYTLPLGLALFTGKHFTDYASQIAGASISIIPMIIIFLVLQRRFIEGVAVTGVKG